MTEQIQSLYNNVEEFNNKVIGLYAPEQPTALSKERFDFAKTALSEELQEFENAFYEGDMGEQADALIDIIYFSLGRLMEMGVPVQNLWDSVHTKNMQKVKGEKNRGTDIDATKPANWVAPDHSWITSIPMPFVEASLLRKKKGEDYRSGNIKMSDYFPFGLKSYTQMLWTKVMRLRSLTDSNKPPKNESVRDTLVDMLNYTTFTIEAMDRGEI